MQAASRVLESNATPRDGADCVATVHFIGRLAEQFFGALSGEFFAAHEL